MSFKRGVTRRHLNVKKKQEEGICRYQHAASGSGLHYVKGKIGATTYDWLIRSDDTLLLTFFVVVLHTFFISFLFIFVFVFIFLCIFLFFTTFVVVFLILCAFLSRFHVVTWSPILPLMVSYHVTLIWRTYGIAG